MTIRLFVYWRYLWYFQNNGKQISVLTKQSFFFFFCYGKNTVQAMEWQRPANTYGYLVSAPGNSLLIDWYAEFKRGLVVKPPMTHIANNFQHARNTVGIAPTVIIFCFLTSRRCSMEKYLAPTRIAERDFSSDVTDTNIKSRVLTSN